MLQESGFQHAWFATHIYRHHRFYFWCKRTLDILVASVLMLLLAPVMLLIVVLIRLDSSGPAIFKQERVGLKRVQEGRRVVWQIRPFIIYKFRTMRRDADPGYHRAFIQAFIHNDEQRMAALQRVDTKTKKLVNDPRVTRVGHFLRKTSLDELPQLWNVLKGEMTLVGPRPAIPYEVEEYAPWHRRRLEALPGLTGLWQVSARSAVDFDTMVELDIEYIERQSLWLDLEILIKTPLRVISGKGAA